MKKIIDAIYTWLLIIGTILFLGGLPTVIFLCLFIL